MRWFGGLSCASIALLGVFFVGCSQEPPVKMEERTRPGVTTDDVKTIEGHLKKAGVDGMLGPINSQPDHWEVEISPYTVDKAGKKRPTPVAPTPYKVMKADGKVTKAQ